MKSKINKIFYLLSFVILIYIVYYFYKNYILLSEFFNNFETKFEVVHIFGKEDRLKNIKNQENKAQIKIDLFEAVNGSKVDIPKLQEEGFIKKPWNTNRYNSAQTKECKEKVINGEIGCYMSHMNLLKKIANSEYDGWTIIFEDDLILNETFKDELNKILKNVEHNNEIDIVYLGSLNQESCDKGIYKENLCYIDNPWGTHAYMVNKRSSQKIYDLIQYIDREIDIKYKDLILEKKINGLIVVPTLVKQNDAETPSGIHGN